MRRTDLALRALRELEHEADTLRAATLAERLGSTRQFMPQVMKPLVQAGWITSDPGPRGGYSLQLNLEHLTMNEFIEVMEGSIDNGRCVLRAGACSGAEECSLHEAWGEARQALTDRLSSIPVSGRQTNEGNRNERRILEQSADRSAAVRSDSDDGGDDSVAQR